jgi:phosphopantetheinyl transferase (holo-ACP synthase)
VPGQKPQLQFHDEAQKRFTKLGAKRVHVTLTHTAHTAMAEVIIED